MSLPIAGISVVSVLAIVSAVVTLLLSPSGFLHLKDRFYEGDRVSWRKAEKLITQVLHQIDESRFTPDIVIGFGRGGALLAAVLVTNLPGRGERRVPLVCIDTIGNPDLDVPESCTVVEPTTPPEIEGKNVLIVVAELYTGNDMRAAMRYVRRHQPAEFRSACLLWGPTASAGADYWGQKTKGAPRAPWRMTPDSRRGRM